MQSMRGEGRCPAMAALTLHTACHGNMLQQRPLSRARKCGARQCAAKCGAGAENGASRACGGRKSTGIVEFVKNLEKVLKCI